ncbi:MAG: type VI secretion system contractile sheath small subunit [Planctomycetaceae bacterium]|nr:type VI secretion system contractile sheath small subunit [Planctomycetaceae bacterium]MCA9030378.1 type VI secretion system contractile sheath small subunit [Planctomycetaceae bacterium]
MKGKVRPPRVHITYDVQVGDAIEQKELPFVVGVMGDYSGNDSPIEKKPLAERSFVNINRDNFNEVMDSISPALNIRVANTLEENGSEMGVQLKFKKMEDFEPGRIVEQVPQLKSLLEMRNKLRDLLANADKKPNLEARLEEILQNTEETARLYDEFGEPEAPSDAQ